MNRREFLASAAIAALLPTWIQKRSVKIDLKAFCRENYRYKIDVPFVQVAERPYTFATDASICIRVPTDDLPEVESIGKLPNACGLPWSREGTVWKPWPAQKTELASDTTCPACHGAQAICRICRKEYDPDDMCKHIITDYERNYLNCSVCKGFGYGIFPGLQKVREVFVDADYDRKIRTKLPGVEYRISTCKINGDPQELVHLRFDGGQGMLMPVKTKKALERLTK